MIPFSEWAPNIHPMFVHFPIGLLFAAALLDLIALLVKDRSIWRPAATTLYVLGGLSAVATWYTGTLAADSVFVPTAAQALLTEHADLGKYTMWAYGGYALLRLALSFGRIGTAAAVRWALAIIGAGGLALVAYTADHGAELVFHHGVGVQAVEDIPTAPRAAGDSAAVETGGFVASDSSGWSWKPTRASAWKSSFSWLEGDPVALKTSLVDAGELGDALSIQTDGGIHEWVVKQDHGSVQADVSVNLDAFEGTAMVVHHVVDAGNFSFVSFGGGEVRLGKSENGDLLVTTTTPAPVKGWQTFRIVSDGEHVRVYAGQDLVAHAHGPEPNPGPVGLRINGSGRLLLSFMEVTPLR